CISSLIILLFLYIFFFFSSRRRHTRSKRDWSSDVCSSDLLDQVNELFGIAPDHDLNIIQPRQTLNAVMAKNITGLDEILEQVAPDAVVVQGDTTTSTAGAIAAFN